MADIAALVKSFIDLCDVMVELYLGSIVKPVLLLYDEFHFMIYASLRKLLDSNPKLIPIWFTTDMIARFRLALTVPTVTLLSLGHTAIPAVLVLLAEFSDILNVAVTNYRIDNTKEQEKMAKKSDEEPPSKSDDDSHEYEVVTTGSPQRITSLTVGQRNRAYDDFINRVCDKVFIIPCWIFLLSSVAHSSLRSIQYLCLWWLIVTESTSLAIDFKMFFADSGLPPPPVEGLEFSTSAIKPEYIENRQQRISLFGTSFFMVPYLKYLGLLVLVMVCPLLYKSLRNKTKTRVIYVCTRSEAFDHKTIKFWTQAKSMGSKLMVGVIGKKQTEMVMNASSIFCVDEVIAEAPTKADLMFLEKQRIDYVVLTSDQLSQTPFVTDEVKLAGKCITLGEDHVFRPLKAKDESKRA